MATGGNGWRWPCQRSSSFHTFDYERHFERSWNRIFGPEGPMPAGVENDGRFIGVSAELLGVDQLDMIIGGFPWKFLVYEIFLEECREWRGEVADVVQNIATVPSRTDCGVEYQLLAIQQVHDSIGRINGYLGTFSWTPVSLLGSDVTTSAPVDARRREVTKYGNRIWVCIQAWRSP